MLPRRALIWLSVSLSLIALLLLLTLFGVKLPSLGRALDQFNTEEPLCQVQWGNTISTIPDLNRCCLEARQQLDCSYQNHTWRCQTGSGAVLKYILNQKAYSYCRQQVIW